MLRSHLRYRLGYLYVTEALLVPFSPCIKFLGAKSQSTSITQTTCFLCCTGDGYSTKHKVDAWHGLDSHRGQSIKHQNQPVSRATTRTTRPHLRIRFDVRKDTGDLPPRRLPTRQLLAGNSTITRPCQSAAPPRKPAYLLCLQRLRFAYGGF